MTRKFDVGCCECTEESEGCCADKTNENCTSSGVPEERCCCWCDDEPPCEIDVTISGVTDFTGGVFPVLWDTCENCTQFNNTFTLQRYASNHTTATNEETGNMGGYCVWWNFFNCQLASDAPHCMFPNDPFTFFGDIQLMVLELWERKFTLRIFQSIGGGGFGGNTRNWCDTFVGRMFGETVTTEQANSVTQNINGILHWPFEFYRPQYWFEFEPSGTGLVDCDLSDQEFTKIDVFPPHDIYNRVKNWWEFGDWSSAEVKVSAG